MKDKKEDIFHSSVYGRAQNGGSLGSASSESFKERMRIDKNRQVVHGYGESQVANSMYGNGPRAKKYTPTEAKTTGKTPTSRTASRTSAAARPAAPRPSFAPNIKPNLGK